MVINRSNILLIKPASKLQLHACIDAELALHNDSELHTGVIIMVDHIFV